MEKKTLLSPRERLDFGAAAAFILMASGCVSGPRSPTAELQAARQASTAVQRVEAQEANNRLQVRMSDADTARADRDVALAVADTAQSLAHNSRDTDRAMMHILGDVLFMTGNADLRLGATGDLNRLVEFLGIHPDRRASIEGHTDSVGNEGYNQGLSLRRADTVRTYLMSRGVAAPRLAALGKGEAYPVASNGSPGGRRQNRRVEVIIGDGQESPAALR